MDHLFENDPKAPFKSPTGMQSHGPKFGKLRETVRDAPIAAISSPQNPLMNS